MNITQVGDSSQLTLGYQDKAKSPTAAKAVILGISSGALDYLAAPESSATQKAVDAANAKIKTAQDAIDKANHRPATRSSSRCSRARPRTT